MPKIQQVARKVQLEVERFDGGRNVKDAPSKLSPFESPDELNVVYDETGSCETRDGSAIFNTTSIGSAPIDGLASYNQTMVVWCGGDMYRMSGTVAVTITSAQSVFVSGAKIAHAQYQNVLFCSDGTSAYRYHGDQSFYQHGIGVPSAAVARSAAVGGINTGTYYYRVAYENTQVVEGQAGSAVTIAYAAAATGVISQIPIGATSLGVAKRIIYRASTSAGPYKYIGEIADNVTSVFTDSMSATTFNAQVRYAIDDGTAPTPYTAIKLHKERLFITDSDRSVMRWTEFTNPYLSPAANYYNLDQGDGGELQAIGVQDDLITGFKNNGIWIGVLNDPSDDTTWTWLKSPANLGIVGPYALWEGPGYIVFMAKSTAKTNFGRIYGLCVLQGLDVQDASYGPLRTKSISEKVEPEVLAFEEDYWQDIAMMGFDNKIHMAVAKEDDSSGNAHIYWLDLNRIVGDQGQPGSWALWDGINVRSWVVHDGKLYAGDRADSGYIYQLYAGQYEDSGAAINSYFYTKPLGGESSIDSWIKDFRYLNVWYAQKGTGTWYIYAKGEQIYDGTSTAYGGDENLIATVVPIELGAVYGTAVYGTSVYYVAPAEIEGQFSLGSSLGRRFSFKFSNGDVVGQAFKVLSLKALMNLRRQK